jgi:hypothetical protein
VHDFTVHAIPAILTGNYPGEDEKQPLTEEYPENLFSLLEGHYAFNSHEEVTNFRRDSTDSVFAALEVDVFMSDMLVLYSHAILPKGTADLFARIDADQWGGFRVIMNRSGRGNCDGESAIRPS